MLILFFLFFYFDTFCVFYNRALSNWKNLILKFPTPLIRLIYISFINYSYYVVFIEVLGLLDQLGKQRKRKLENEQHSGSSFSNRFLKITVPKTFRGIFRTQSNIQDGVFFVKVFQFLKNTQERVYYLMFLITFPHHF